MINTAWQKEMVEMVVVPGSRTHHHRTKLEAELAATPELFGRILLRLSLIRELEEILADLNTDLTTDLEVLHGTVTDLLAAYATAVQLDKDLQAAADSNADRSLTPAQTATIRQSVADMKQEMLDALTPAVTNPAVIPEASGNDPNAPPQPIQSRVTT